MGPILGDINYFWLSSRGTCSLLTVFTIKKTTATFLYGSVFNDLNNFIFTQMMTLLRFHGKMMLMKLPNVQSVQRTSENRMKKFFQMMTAQRVVKMNLLVQSQLNSKSNHMLVGQINKQIECVMAMFLSNLLWLSATLACCGSMNQCF